ncbi:hypothetical protein Pfo_028118 [Paulownia fortunei]|nr:hypothetical protein Pfo_028118 [Paulownia fortunei]
MYDPIFAKSFSRYQRKRFGCCALFLCLIIALGISSTSKPHLHPLSLIGDAVNLQLSINAVEDMLTIDDTRDIRIQANSSTIFVVTPLESIPNSTNSWSIEPYPRKGTSRVKNWTVKRVGYKHDDDSIPKCTQNHSHPAILFSVGGFSGNHFHDFADVLFPLYSTSFHFRKEVHFLASDCKQWWISKFRQILNKLTRHEIIDIDREKGQVHCYNKMVAGLKFHKELIIDPSLSNSPTGPSMHNFRQLLRQAYSLERKRAIRSRKGDGTRPRLMIISRKRTRILTNEGEVSRLARKLGYEVVLTEAGVSTNLSRFAQIVNSCDVLMGIHGAGLTNMVFLPDNAVLIQVVPFGDIDGFARLDFGNPAAGMNLRYLEYKITVKESSLSQQYPIDHPVLKDPKSYKGWSALWSIYLDKQNVTVDLHRVKGTVAKALKLLRH